MSDHTLRDEEARAGGLSAAGADVDVDASSWIWDGILSGVLGAAVIALFFLLVDLVEGRPFWTPTALGTAVFLGKSLAADAAPRAAMVAAYTVLHGAVFVVAGLAASFGLLGHRKNLGPLAGVVTAVVFFIALEAFFLIFFTTFADSVSGGLFSELGTGKIAMANLLAAGAMAATTLRPPLER